MAHSLGEGRLSPHQSLRLKRTIPLAQVWDLIGRLYTKKKREQMRRMAGFVLLERAGAAQ